MTTPEPHMMTLEQTFPSGAQQWHCPACQRRTVLHFLPQSGRLKSITLEAGDEAVSHCTGSSALKMASASASESHGMPAPADGSWLH